MTNKKANTAGSFLIFLLVCIGIDMSAVDNTTFYKNIIRNRSKIHPENYNYAVVRKKSDLKYIKNRKFRPNSHKKVYNYVEIKNVHESLYNRSVNNIGLNLKGKKDRVVNIVKIKNSSLNSNALTGVKIKSGKNISLKRVKINNSVTIDKSEIGSRKNRLIYKAYKYFKSE